MRDLRELPERETIQAWTRIPTLKGLLDDLDDEIVTIETQLKHSTKGADWENRAVAALARFRATRRWVARRLHDLQSIGKKEEQVRPDDMIHPRTLAALAERPNVDASKIETLEELETVLTDWVATLDAVREDREDEIGQGAGRRDEGFLARTNSLIRHMAKVRQDIQNRRGQLSKAAKKARVGGVDELTRDRAFVKAAVATLPPAVMEALWRAADSLLEAHAAGKVTLIEDKAA